MGSGRAQGSQAVFSRRAVLNVAMLLRDSVVARQVRTYLLDVEQDGRPHPVDNTLRARVDIDPTALDERLAPHRAVRSEEMREFVGAAKGEYGAEVALFVTSAPFTPAALDLAARHGITAVHRALLEAWSTGTVLQVLR